MDRTQYLEKKKRFLEQQKVFENGHRQLCLECLRPTKACFCSSIKRFNTKTIFRILMHPMEAKERVATGRLSNVCLNNSRIHVGIDFNEDSTLQKELQDHRYYPVVLYPGDKSHNISKEGFKSQLPKDKTLLILVIDATWPHAKLIMRENLFLHKLPWISFDPPGVSAFSIKHQPSKFCLSTIESLYYVLCGLKKNFLEPELGSSHEELILTLKKLVDFQKKCASDPSMQHYRNSGGYKNPEQRSPSRKWKSRSICFDERNYHENDYGPLDKQRR